MQPHVMIDLETLSLADNALILSLGAVKFDPNAKPIGDKHELIDAFYVAIDPTSCQQFGLHIDAGTVMWWLQQDRADARAALLGTRMHDLPTALEAFGMWYGPDSLPTWGNGAAYDNVVLKNAFKAINQPRPWHYRDDRCYRTVRALAPGVPMTDVGTAHVALDDATAQAYHLQDIVQHLGLAL